MYFGSEIEYCSFEDSLFNYLNSDASKKDKLNRIINDIDILIEYKSWYILEDIWKNIDLKKYDKEIYVALLKRTMSSSNIYHLSNRAYLAISRKDFYNKVKDEFKNRKIKNYKKLLQSLE